MEMDQSKLIESLSSMEIDTLINLYYNQEGKNQGIALLSLPKKTLTDLVEKNLISTELGKDESLISLTDEGLSLCGAVMKYQINEKQELFKEKIQSLPERAIATLVNRVMWKDELKKESGAIDPITNPYALDESLWYERVLLKDKRIQEMLENFYTILENVDLVKNIDEQRWCSPEVEEYLKNEYGSMMDLTWQEEDSLKYCYFFLVYAQNQKNLINFSGEGEELKSMFFSEDYSLPDYWFSTNRSNSCEFITALGISEQRAIGFLREMESRDIVNKRYYPLSSFSYFNEDDNFFVVKDVKAYIDFITIKFLTSVSSSLVN